MKTVIAVAAVILSCAGAVCAQTLDDLKNDGKNPDNILTYGMGYAQNRYSPLAQINKSNIKKLVPVWTAGLENELGEQAQPIIHNGVMYVSNARWTVALDALSGRQLWRTAVDFPPETPRVVCCGVSNKGVAVYNGKVFRTTLHAYVVALDQKTGKELWKQKAAEWTEGYSQTVAPLIANGVLVTGISGAEFGIRGFLDGWDPDTGKHLWRRYTTAGPDDKGHDTWEPRTSYVNGGASTWITGSYDPQLDLMYWGTGNAGAVEPARAQRRQPLCRVHHRVRPKTGEIVWHYQATPNDIYDWDAVWEVILADINVNGVPRKVAMQMNRNGFLYVLDRATGELLSAKPFGELNWATHVDMKTGRPVESEGAKKYRAGEPFPMWPSVRGAKNWPHAAFNPNTGLLYANTNHSYSTVRMLELAPYKAGTRYVGVENTYPTVNRGDIVGHIEAIDPMTATPKWRIPVRDYQIASAMLATGGGLLFSGKHTGEFFALDADTGQTLWEFRTSSGVNAMPVTWTHKGKQYVTVLSGLGGLYGTRAREALKDVPVGGSVWTFALQDN
jgi:alcohol dehydrogenase (cytochrome c)